MTIQGRGLPLPYPPPTAPKSGLHPAVMGGRFDHVRFRFRCTFQHGQNRLWSGFQGLRRAIWDRFGRRFWASMTYEPRTERRSHKNIKKWSKIKSMQISSKATRTCKYWVEEHMCYSLVALNFFRKLVSWGWCFWWFFGHFLIIFWCFCGFVSSYAIQAGSWDRFLTKSSIFGRPQTGGNPTQSCMQFDTNHFFYWHRSFSCFRPTFGRPPDPILIDFWSIFDRFFIDSVVTFYTFLIAFFP